MKNAKICFILSPGWFETDGTNIEAFLDFVRPNFLSKIIFDSSIQDEDKLYIGKYISKNYALIENASTEIKYFNNAYKYRFMPILGNYFFSKTKNISKVKYVLKENSVLNKKAYQFELKLDWHKMILKKSEEFKKTIKLNTLFINDDYFKNEVLRKNGEIRKGHYDKINCNNNQELNDFYQLIKLIKATKCKASFIIQGLNPYHYLSLENFNPTLNKICSTLKKEKIPFLNQFTTNKKKYIPGTLNDIMHIGDVGWLQIDKFLIETYGH